jgi:GntR family transcriptional regulator / MocR family aminotransferase
MPPAIAVDRRLSRPVRSQIYEQWRAAILSGRFAPGKAVPSTRELATTLGVARSTVVDAYGQLIAEGYLDASHGSGTFVCRKLPDDLLSPHRAPASARRDDAAMRLSRYGSSLIDDHRRNSGAPGTIEFPAGSPDLSRFPFALWRRLLARRLRRARPAVFDYAEAAGYGPLREQISAYVARIRAVRCTPDQVIVVNGSQQALDLCARLLVEPGDEAGIENPGYHGARRVLAAHGARLRPLTVDGDGAMIGGAGRNTRLVYTTPSHQFPTGVSMSLGRRLEWLAWARSRGAALIEDDYCSEYRYSGPPLPSLQGLDPGAPVIYIGTFSKVMFPGLRIGYVIAPPALVDAFGRAKWLTDRQTPWLEQAALADFIADGYLERHVRRMLRLYGSRREALVSSLHEHFGRNVHVLGDAAGMHVTVQFDDERIAQRAARNRVHLVTTAYCYLDRAASREFIFGFSAMTERALHEGVKALAR